MVNSQGPIVTSIRKFPVKRSRDRVIVRLNVEADHSADKVMQEEFWPHGITCRPWMSREALRKQRVTTTDPGQPEEPAIYHHASSAPTSMSASNHVTPCGRSVTTV
ncbi:hypothetical protein DPMN_107263 [Dreissena polymorpha]|uniref:Uncharacterized protein n=1 Tax=Dreissena polymorpha TaxID=45954 RepID=A0A9D4K6E3_DREPO|nr:hypothetical protein DPMN_107263 [Dreissena polymorpha]